MPSILHFYAAVTIIRLFEILFAWLGMVIVALYFRIQLGICSHPLVLEFGAGVGIAYLLINRGLRFSPRAGACSSGRFFAGWYWIFVHGATDPQFARVPTYGLGGRSSLKLILSWGRRLILFAPEPTNLGYTETRRDHVCVKD